VHDPLAWADQSRFGVKRDHVQPGLDAHVAGRGLRSRHQGETAERPDRGRKELQGSSRWLQLPALPDRQDRHKGPRQEYFYFSDDGDLLAMRYDNWKFVFAQQRSPGTLALWGEPFVKTRIPWLYNLRTDPYEKATITSNTYWDWYVDHVFLIAPSLKLVGDFLATFKEYPPRQKPSTATVDQAIESLLSATTH
jgi:hypothetical protein